eukprot:3264328-Rhodomonas_salina.2
MRVGGVSGGGEDAAQARGAECRGSKSERRGGGRRENGGDGEGKRGRESGMGREEERRREKKREGERGRERERGVNLGHEAGTDGVDGGQDQAVDGPLHHSQLPPHPPRQLSVAMIGGYACILEIGVCVCVCERERERERESEPLSSHQTSGSGGGFTMQFSSGVRFRSMRRRRFRACFRHSKSTNLPPPKFTAQIQRVVCSLGLRERGLLAPHSTALRILRETNTATRGWKVGRIGGLGAGEMRKGRIPRESEAPHLSPKALAVRLGERMQTREQ